ncbi:helix-turn-helix transcriptional regulator [Escherichia coli]|uniref:helix-turn-helix transcriptional regulator n=2 Tax=Escherichia coli TaxID=562 RepID=UPI0022815030|nr:AlpA family phage regulatory protein [Escherichia coli]
MKTYFESEDLLCCALYLPLDAFIFAVVALSGSALSEVYQMKTQYLRPKDLANQLGISVSSLWRWARTGKIPKPIKLSERVTAWSSTEINSWLEAKK